MEAKQEILLEQMLEELRAQTRALQEIQRRLEEMERTRSPRPEDLKPAIERTDR